jgi:hypothetical protein
MYSRCKIDDKPFIEVHIILQQEQLSQQLKDALDRLKLHELDKVQLAQQLLLAEEER